MIKLSEIPIDFVLNNLTYHKKKSIEIKYYVRMRVESWDGKKFELYENLSNELNLCFETIRKIAKEPRYVSPALQD